MSDRIERIKVAVEAAVSGPVVHVQSVPVRETFRGNTVWEGVVEVFSVKQHSPVSRCYGWVYQDDRGESHYVTVMEKPPVTSPQTAVKAYVSSLK